MQNNILSLSLPKVILCDSICLALFLYLPALSHYSSVPLYRFEPMRIMLLINLLLLGNKKNSYFLAFILPFFSFIVSGHPLLPKAIIMSLELLINVFLFFFFFTKVNAAASLFVSIIASKGVFYILKFLLVSLGFLNISLVETNLFFQVIVTGVLSLCFLCYKRK